MSESGSLLSPASASALRSRRTVESRPSKSFLRPCSLARASQTPMVEWSSPARPEYSSSARSNPVFGRAFRLERRLFAHPAPEWGG